MKTGGGILGRGEPFGIGISSVPDSNREYIACERSASGHDDGSIGQTMKIHNDFWAQKKNTETD